MCWHGHSKHVSDQIDQMQSIAKVSTNGGLADGSPLLTVESYCFLVNCSGTNLNGPSSGGRSTASGPSDI